MKATYKLYLLYLFSSVLALNSTSLTTINTTTTNECVEYFEQFSLSKIEGILPVLVDSGRSPFDLGNYEACIATNDTNYFLLNILIMEPSIVSFSLGLCVPSACNLNDTQSYLDSKLQFFNTILTQLNSTAQISEIVVLDISDIPYESNGWLYLIIVILSIFVILCVVATIKYQYTNIKNEDHLDKRDNEDISFQMPINENKMKNEVSTFNKVLDCFEFSKNFQKLFNTKLPEEHDKNLGVLNGIRTLSFFYVVYGHEYNVRGTIGTNITQFYNILNQKWGLFIISGLYAVDVFLFLSGFLVAFVMLGKLKKVAPSFKNYFSIVLHRYLRIMPLYIVCIFIYWKLSVYVGSGPLWSSYVGMVNDSCDTRWWQHLFFGDNFFFIHYEVGTEYCFAWGWYLAVDFQLFLFTPFLLWYYIYDQRKGKICIAIVTLGFFIGSIVLSIVDKIALFPLLEASANLDFNYWYYTPYARGSPYYYGLFLGILYKEWKNPEQHGRFIKLILNSRLFRVVISLFGIGMMMFIMWIPEPLQNNPNAWPSELQYFFLGVEKLVFTIGTSLFIMPSLLGKNRLFSSMLNNTFFYIIAKISYCGYLIHYMIICIGAYSSKQTYVLNNTMILYDWIDTLVLTMPVSIMLILLVELPFVNLERIFMSKKPTQVKRIQEIKNPLLSGNDTESG